MTMKPDFPLRVFSYGILTYILLDLSIIKYLGFLAAELWMKKKFVLF